MCRLVAYLGQDILLADVLVKPEDSIIKQSLAARESLIPTNGDGFGIGWYIHEISPYPAIFLSIMPAWNDENLLHLTTKIKSPLFFGHVRAASTGGVNNYNCHPFIHKQWMFMHNGQIHDFLAIKRELRNILDDDIYHWLKGATDSEHFFALFLQLAKGKNLESLSSVADVLRATFIKIEQLLQKAKKTGDSFYNICITDGKRMVATRYCTNNEKEPESLHYLTAGFRLYEDDYFAKKTKSHKCVLIASEKLTHFISDWHMLPAHHLLLVENDQTIKIETIF